MALKHRYDHLQEREGGERERERKVEIFTSLNHLKRLFLIWKYIKDGGSELFKKYTKLFLTVS